MCLAEKLGNTHWVLLLHVWILTHPNCRQIHKVRDLLSRCQGFNSSEKFCTKWRVDKDICYLSDKNGGNSSRKRKTYCQNAIPNSSCENEARDLLSNWYICTKCITKLLSVSTFLPIKEHSGTQQGVAAADDAPLETWNARSIHWLFEKTEACHDELSYLWKLV